MAYDPKFRYLRRDIPLPPWGIAWIAFGSVIAIYQYTLYAVGKNDLEKEFQR